MSRREERRKKRRRKNKSKSKSKRRSKRKRKRKRREKKKDKGEKEREREEGKRKIREKKKGKEKRKEREQGHLKREAIEQTIQTAAAAGRAPPGPRPSLHVRWDKLLEGKESSPGGLLSEYFKELYGVQGAAKTRAAEARVLAITGWIDKEDEVQKQGTSGIDATGFATCTQKAQEREEQSRWTDCRSPAEPSPWSRGQGSRRW